MPNAAESNCVCQADVHARLEDAGMAPIGNTMAQFAALIKHGFQVCGRTVKLAGVQPE